MYETALAFSVLCFLGVSLYYVRSPAFSLFHPLTFYLAFHALVFVVRPILAWSIQYRALYYAYEFMPSMADKITVIVGSTLGMLCFAFGSLRTGHQPMQFTRDPAIVEEQRRLMQIFAWVVVICAPPAIYSLMNSFGDSGNFDGMIIDKSTGVSINTKNNGYVTDLQMMAVSLAALIVWLGRFRWYSFLPIFAFAMLRAGTGGRSPFVITVVSAGLFYMYEKKMRYPGIQIIAGLVLLIAAFSAVGADRGAAVRQLVGLEEDDAFTAADRDDPFMMSMDYANMEYFEYLVYVIPQRSGTYDYFLDNLQVFTEPVPRLMWTGKPVGEPFRRISLLDYGYPIGMTKSLPGEGWYALGWVGIIVWCGGWGLALGAAYASFVSRPQTTFRTSCYLIYLPTLIVVFRDGTLLQLIRSTGVYFTPVAVWYMLAKYFGVPNAAEIRAVMAHQAALLRKAVRPASAAADTDAGAPPRTVPATWAGLPAAVRRRRLALARQTPPTA